ncbi:MAG: hypothetical protein Q4A88_01945, partial [Clostridia bacterium]|nr:hypothetical protein [Clostridia bacterium]
RCSMQGYATSSPLRGASPQGEALEYALFAMLVHGLITRSITVVQSGAELRQWFMLIGHAMINKRQWRDTQG